MTDLGALPVPAAGEYGDVAFDPFNNHLYAVSFDPNFSLNSVLYDIPVNNPAGATAIGSTGFTGLNALEVSATGTVYAVGGPNLNTLYTINTGTGAATAVGTGTYFSSGDLEFVNGTLYLTSLRPGMNDLLYSINTSTGAGTAIGSGLGFSRVFGTAFDDATNTFYGFTNPSSGTPQVISIDTTLGVGTLVHTYGSLTNAFIGDTDVDSPEPGTVALSAFGLAALLGFAHYRRRKASV
jgi:hypothetical protein